MIREFPLIKKKPVKNYTGLRNLLVFKGRIHEGQIELDIIFILIVFDLRFDPCGLFLRPAKICRIFMFHIFREVESHLE